MSLTDQIEECDVHTIATILCGDVALAREKDRLSGALGISSTIIYDYEQISRSDTYRFLNLMLNKWISKDGQFATRERLINVLRKEGFVNVCGKLQNISSSTDPVWFDVREDVNEFTGREEILHNLHKALTEERNKRITVITTLYGLGGIGKTTLAVRYAWLYRENKFYQNVIWVNAETTQTINGSFNRLADKLVISTVDKKSKQLPLREIVCKVYEYFRGKGNTLFILDNATDYESIEDCLPPPKTPDVTPPFVLLTSRHTKWGDSVKPVQLDVFSEVESVKFLTNYLKLETESEISFARKIADMLENLPLAVRQAGAYIKMQTRLGLKTKEDSLEEYITDFCDLRKSEELLGFEHWTETKDMIHEKTTLLTWDLTLQRIRKENAYTEVIMHIIAYLNPDNIPTQLFESLIAKSNVQYTTWLERFRSLCGCKVESNLPQSMGSTIMPAIKLLADYSMITTQTSFRRGMISVHRLVQRIVRIRTERAHKFSKLGDCVRLFETYFHSNKSSESSQSINESTDLLTLHLTQSTANNSSNEAEILIQAETLKDNIRELKLSNKYMSFIQLVKRKLENLLLKQITLFENMIDVKEYEQAFEMSRNPQLFGSNVSMYKLYIRGTFEIVLEHVENLIKSSRTECLVKVFTTLNEPYFLALYTTDIIKNDLWVRYGSLLSKCFVLCDRSKNAEDLMGKLKLQLIERLKVARGHLKGLVDLSALLQITKDFISCLDGTPDNELRKIGFIREFICVVEERANQNIVEFANLSLVSVIELIDYVIYVHPESKLHVRDEFLKFIHDTFIYSISRLNFSILLKLANSTLLCYQSCREYNAIPLILKEVILTIDSTSEHNSHSTVSEIRKLATIIYKLTVDENFKHDTDLYSQLLHISKLNYNAIRVHSIFETASYEADMILYCLVALDSDVLEILEFSRKYVNDFGYHATGSSLTVQQFKSMNCMIQWFQELVEHGTTGHHQDNEKYKLLVRESFEISEKYFEIILARERSNLKWAYLALNPLKIRINCIQLEMFSRPSPLRSIYGTLFEPVPVNIHSELETVFRSGKDVRNPDSFKHDVLEYLELLEMEIVSLEAIPSILELGLVDVMRLSAEIKFLSSDYDGALEKLETAQIRLNTSLVGNPKSIEKITSVTLKIKDIQKAMDDALAWLGRYGSVLERIRNADLES